MDKLEVYKKYFETASDNTHLVMHRGYALALISIVERLEKEKTILIKEIQRLHNERYKQPSVVAELLKLRAYIFTCSYKTAWEQHLEDDEKFNFTFEEIEQYIRLTTE